MKVSLMFMFGDLLDDHRKLPLNENEGNSHDEDEEIIQAISQVVNQIRFLESKQKTALWAVNRINLSIVN